MHRSFELSIQKEDFCGYSLELSGCMWIWVGRSGIQSLGLGHFPLSSMVIDTPDTRNILVKSTTMRLAKLYADKQVFFSTDILNEDPIFWKELFDALKANLAVMT